MGESALVHRHLTHTVYDRSPQPKNRGWLHRLRVLCLNWLPRQQGGQLSARDLAATMSPWTSPECFYLLILKVDVHPTASCTVVSASVLSAARWGNLMCKECS